MERVQWLIGLAVTLAGLVVLRLDGWRGAENLVQDKYAANFAYFSPGPTGEVVPVAIDTRALQTIGRWPWPRATVARAIDELSAAGAKVIAFDTMLEEPQAERLLRDAANPEVTEIVRDDEVMAAAIRAHGAVILGASFNISQADDREDRARPDAVGTAETVRFEDALSRLMVDPSIDDAALRDLLPERARSLQRGPEVDALRNAVSRARTLIAVSARSTIALPIASPLRFPDSNDPAPPIPVLADASAGIASVSFASGDLDGAVRRMPLWVRVGDRLYPTLGLATACLHLGIGWEDVRIEGRFTVLRVPDGREVRLQMHRGVLTDLASRGRTETLCYVTWPRGGRGGHEAQFAPTGQTSGGEVSLGRVLETDRLLQDLRAHLEMADRAIAIMAGLRDFQMVDDAAGYEARAELMRRAVPLSEEWESLLGAQRSTWDTVAALSAQFVKDMRDMGYEPESLEGDDRAAAEALFSYAQSLPVAIREVDEAAKNVRASREWLRSRVNGRACVIGWTATGAITDVVSTSIDSFTPGMHVHTAVADSIVRQVRSTDARYALWYAPGLAAPAVLLALGLACTWIGVRFSVLTSPVAMAGTVLAWTLINGLLIWDWADTIVPGAGASITGFAAWLAVMLHRLLIEQTGRRRTEARFRSYVAPEVVDILVNNPALSSMAPQKRELTIMFSDIAGFTTISEKLGTDGIGKLLAVYLGAMTDILQRNRATLDKYLGDGIMAFWGAPIDDPDHARHAAAAVVEMLDTLDRMNREGAFSEVGTLSVRVGLATGEVNVGDFGNPPHKSAYTVIGDSVNLAARLESANKQFDTQVLVNQRFRELLDPTTVVRPIGRVIVKGKTEPEMLYELVGGRLPRGEQTREWIAMTEAVVLSYTESRFDDCIAAVAALEDKFGEHHLAELYFASVAAAREAISQGGTFNGAIALRDK